MSVPSLLISLFHRFDILVEVFPLFLTKVTQNFLGNVLSDCVEVTNFYTRMTTVLDKIVKHFFYYIPKIFLFIDFKTSFTRYMWSPELSRSPEWTHDNRFDMPILRNHKLIFYIPLPCTGDICGKKVRFIHTTMPAYKSNDFQFSKQTFATKILQWNAVDFIWNH